MLRFPLGYIVLELDSVEAGLCSVVIVQTTHVARQWGWVKIGPRQGGRSRLFGMFVWTLRLVCCRGVGAMAVWSMRWWSCAISGSDCWFFTVPTCIFPLRSLPLEVALPCWRRMCPNVWQFFMCHVFRFWWGLHWWSSAVEWESPTRGGVMMMMLLYYLMDAFLLSALCGVLCCVPSQLVDPPMWGSCIGLSLVSSINQAIMLFSN